MTPALPAGSVIVLIGADDSGKARLAEALAQRLAQRGIAASLVVESVLEGSFDAGTLEAHRGALDAVVDRIPGRKRALGAPTSLNRRFSVVRHGPTDSQRPETITIEPERVMPVTFRFSARARDRP